MYYKMTDTSKPEGRVCMEGAEKAVQIILYICANLIVVYLFTFILLPIISHLCNRDISLKNPHLYVFSICACICYIVGASLFPIPAFIEDKFMERMEIFSCSAEDIRNMKFSSFADYCTLIRIHLTYKGLFRKSEIRLSFDWVEYVKEQCVLAFPEEKERVLDAFLCYFRFSELPADYVRCPWAEMMYYSK